jgi:hypothetical protein
MGTGILFKNSQHHKDTIAYIYAISVYVLFLENI